MKFDPWTIDWTCNVQSGIRMEGEPVPPLAPTPVEPAIEPVVEPTAAAPVGDETKVEPTVAPVEPSPAPGPDWRARQLAKKNAQIAEMRTELEQLRAGAPTSAGPVPGSAEYNDAVRREAQRLNAEEATRKASNEVVTAGRAKYSDFTEKVQTFQSFFDGTDPNSAAKYTQIVEAAMETGDGADILYALGNHPEEAERILDMTPGRMAVALTKLGEKQKGSASPSPSLVPQIPANPLSLAPAPIRPINPSGPTHEEIDPSDPKKAGKLSIDTWMKRRDQQALAEAQRRGDYRAMRIPQTRH